MEPTPETTEAPRERPDRQLHVLWPTLVLRSRFPDHEACRDELLAFVDDYAARHESRSGPENRELFESSYDLWQNFAPESDALSCLGLWLQEQFLHIARQANSGAWKANGYSSDRVGVQLTGLWFVRYEKGGFVLPHIHGLASWSCVYYLRGESSGEDPLDGGTYFVSPQNKGDQADPGDLYTRQTVQPFAARAGDALFFPSHLVHGSYPWSSPERRVIFSANARFGYRGERARPTAGSPGR